MSQIPIPSLECEILKNIGVSFFKRTISCNPVIYSVPGRPVPPGPSRGLPEHCGWCLRMFGTDINIIRSVFDDVLCLRVPLTPPPSALGAANVNKPGQ